MRMKSKLFSYFAHPFAVLRKRERAVLSKYLPTCSDLYWLHLIFYKKQNYKYVSNIFIIIIIIISFESMKPSMSLSKTKI